MKKIYKKLTKEQLKRNVIFSNCLSEFRTEMENDRIHEIFKDWSSEEKLKTAERLMNDKFFNASHWNFNIIRE